MLYCVLKLRTVISTLRWAVLAVLWIGFCHTGPISLCVDLIVFVCICIFFCFWLHSCCIIVSAVGWTLWDWSLILWTIFLKCFDTVVVGSLPRRNPSPIWPYNVFGGTLSLTQSISQAVMRYLQFYTSLFIRNNQICYTGILMYVIAVNKSQKFLLKCSSNFFYISLSRRRVVIFSATTEGGFDFEDESMFFSTTSYTRIDE